MFIVRATLASQKQVILMRRKAFSGVPFYGIRGVSVSVADSPIRENSPLVDKRKPSRPPGLLFLACSFVPCLAAAEVIFVLHRLHLHEHTTLVGVGEERRVWGFARLGLTDRQVITTSCRVSKPLQVVGLPVGPAMRAHRPFFLDQGQEKTVILVHHENDQNIPELTRTHL